MLLKGCRTELMVQVNPLLYSKFLIYNKNYQALLYMILLKASYGLLKNALLFYRKFVDNIQN
jgi:hypothetical protein